jgi:homoprotocatechuate degradation regulator HpaR
MNSRQYDDRLCEDRSRMSDPIAYPNLPLRLLQAREAVLSHFRPILSHFGLTEQQWRLIRALYEAGETEPRILSETCHILGPSLTGILTRMEENGLVRRTRMAGDQRRILVALTDKSEALIGQVGPLIAEQYRLLEAAWGREMVASVYAVTDRVLAMAGVPVRSVLPEPRD